MRQEKIRETKVGKKEKNYHYTQNMSLPTMRIQF